jgi:hypothetical protein
MQTKYNTEIDNQIIINNLKRLINQIYKLLPNREEGIDWSTPLSTITEEIAGMGILFNAEIGPDSLSLLSKLEGLNSLDGKDDFFNFRRTIFECLNLMNKIKDYVEPR